MHPETKRREYVSSIHRELEIERNWYRHGLREILDSIVWEDQTDEAKVLKVKSIALSHLDGEPTTADESNVVYISDVNKEIAKEWKKDTMQEDEKLVFKEQFGDDKDTMNDYVKLESIHSSIQEALADDSNLLPSIKEELNIALELIEQIREHHPQAPWNKKGK